MRLANTEIAHANKAKIESLDGVISVVEKAGQFQVVIGPAVPQIYDELIENTNLMSNDSKDTEKEENTNWFLKLMDVIGGIFTPLLPLFAGSGVFRGLVGDKVKLAVYEFCNISYSYGCFDCCVLFLTNYACGYCG